MKEKCVPSGIDDDREILPADRDVREVLEVVVGAEEDGGVRTAASRAKGVECVRLGCPLGRPRDYRR